MGKRYSNVMIDLETLGTGDDAMVISIGAVGFELELTTKEGDQLSRGFEIAIDPLIAVGEIDASTAIWWMHQSKEAQDSTFSGANKGISSQRALLFLDNYLHNYTIGKDVRVWANGPTFDLTKLERLFKKFEMPLPWKYSAGRDVRTMRQLDYELDLDAELPEEGVGHNCLDDAIWQAKYMINIFKALKCQKK